MVSNITFNTLPQCFDLDAGNLGPEGDSACDFTLSAHESAGTLNFVPAQSASFGFGGVFPAPPSLSHCLGSEYLSSQPEGIAPLASYYVCYRNNQGYTGYLHFTGMSDEPFNLSMIWETFE